MPHDLIPRKTSRQFTASLQPRQPVFWLLQTQRVDRFGYLGCKALGSSPAARLVPQDEECGPGNVGRGSFYSSQTASPSSPGPQTASLVPPWGPLPGCGEHCRLITDLRAKLIFSSDRDVLLKNDFNPLLKVAPLAQAVQQTTTTSAASTTSHQTETSELDWLKL